VQENWPAITDLTGAEPQWRTGQSMAAYTAEKAKQ
jgi:hypothetical protein